MIDGDANKEPDHFDHVCVTLIEYNDFTSCSESTPDHVKKGSHQFAAGIVGQFVVLPSFWNGFLRHLIPSALPE